MLFLALAFGGLVGVTVMALACASGRADERSGLKGPPDSLSEEERVWVGDLEP